MSITAEQVKAAQAILNESNSTSELKMYLDGLELNHVTCSFCKKPNIFNESMSLVGNRLACFSCRYD